MRKKEASKAQKPRANAENWEELAAQGIKKKNLSLDRDWNEKTWTNKASCHERLKMLKDDGIDIAPLQGLNVSSESITRAVIAQVNARKGKSSSRDSSQSTYHPLSNLPLKRKRLNPLGTETSSPGQLHIAEDDYEPAFKKRCTTDLRMAPNTSKPVSEEETPTWPLLKFNILVDIFKLVPTPKLLPVRTPQSRIVISFASQSAVEAAPNPIGSFELNSKGYDNIMSDLRVLSETLDESGNFGIHDPAAPAYPPGIYVITDQPRKIILEGQALALIGLLSRLRTPGKGLAHAAKRFFDETGERKAVGRVYELGAGTMKQLESIEAELETRDDGCEVWVKWVYTGKTEMLKAKMY
ncbi:hypothetical protein BDU57DRAFT_441904 [Ampelomyces quisqualis]|uniref:Uncharacterized protein n=1 Tax=Ampelomyces quisqualis TaxID=50730 RepID=A0A6A5QWV3_AMPQU|nr:hypothetical protein BDU57DRAFT_441904 [Ampelomyces quisqualis]